MSATDHSGKNGNAANDVTRHPLRDGIDDAKSHIGDVAATARERAFDVIGGAREKVGGLGGAVDGNPIATLVGGIALGIVVGALLPRTERESEVLGSLGQRLQEGARQAVDAARGAGQEKFAEFGLDRDHLRQTARGFVENVISAAASAGAAALDSTGRPSARD